MTRQPAPLTLKQASPLASPPPPAREDATGSVRRAGLVAGVVLLLLAGLAAFGDLVVVDGLVTTGDAAQTANDVLASEGTFRLGVASLYAVIVLDVVAAWALFRFFAPVNGWVSRLTAWFRLAYAVALLVAAAQLVGVPALLRDDAYRAAFGERQLQAQVLLKFESYSDIWMAGLLLFGVHLMGLGYLAFRSGYVPRAIGVLLVVAGAGYAFDTFSSVLWPNPVIVSTVTFLGEFLLAVWLVLRGGSVRVGAHHEP
jgi:hypothetical protein